MSGFDHQKAMKAAKNLYEESVGWLALVIGGIAAYYLTAPIYHASVGAVSSYGSENYFGFVGMLVSYVWFVVVAAITFLLARIAIAALMMGTVFALFMRFARSI